MVNKSWPANCPAGRIAQQHGVAIAQDGLAAAALNSTEPAEVQVKTEIIVAVTAVPTCMHVAYALHGAGKQAKLGQLPNTKVDVAEPIRNWIEGDPG